MSGGGGGAISASLNPTSLLPGGGPRINGIQVFDPAGEMRQKMAAKLGIGANEYVAPEALDAAARQDILLRQARAELDKDLAQGRERGNAEFGEGSLGRIGETRSGDISDVIGRRKEQLQGFTAEERNALSDQAEQGVQQSMGSALRQLRGIQGASGVRGGLAANQAMKLIGAGDQSRVNAARDLFVQEAGMKRDALGKLEDSLRKTEGDELARQQFNMDQKMREKYGKVGLELGYGSLGAGQRGAIGQQVVGEAAAQAAANRPSGGKK